MRLSWAMTVLAALLWGCGTTYQLPDVTAADREAAARQVTLEQRKPSARGLTRSQFWATANRTEPVAERYCAQYTEREVTCNLRILLDTNRTSPANAYHYMSKGQPVIEVTQSLLDQMRSTDQLAFVIGHESAHYIAAHIEKMQQQMLVGAAIGGIISGAIEAQDDDASDSDVAGAVVDGIVIGAMIGQLAYSQTYELEADMIGTRITEAAGYDAMAGATFFAMTRPGGNSDGTLTFWETHPPDRERMAMINATVRQMRR